MKLVVRYLLFLFCLVGSIVPAYSRGVQQSPGEPTNLTIGLMPAVDIAPILVAQEQGFFQQAGITVDLEIFTSAQDRQSALQVGAVDGALTDLVAVALNVAGGFALRATTSTEGMFMILGYPDSLPTPTSPDSQSIGLMEVSVTNYLADSWLGNSRNLDKVYMNDIGARLEATINRQITMGVFPEPLATVGISRGLTPLAQSSTQDYSPQVLAFTQITLDTKGFAVHAFHRAYNQAVVAITRNPELARDALIQNIPNINPSIRDLITLPRYRQAYLPDTRFIQEIITWTAKVSNRELTLDPDDLIDRRFIP